MKGGVEDEGEGCAAAPSRQLEVMAELHPGAAVEEG